MSIRQAILKQMTDTRNQAVEEAVECALAESTGAEQAELAELLLQRNRRNGWVALIRAFNRLAPEIQDKVVARPRDLFGPLAETMQDSNGPARENVIHIVKRCADARLVYLLAEALIDARPEVRDLAGTSFLDAVRRYCDRTHPHAFDRPAEIEDAAQIGRAIDYALRRFKSHRQTAALTAALIHERQQDSTLWAMFQDPYDDLTRAATVTLRAPQEPALATALLLALASPLKTAAMAGLAAVESPAVACAVAAQSFRLLDPLLLGPARGITHLKMLPALRKNMPWNSGNWAAWLTLIERVGLQPAERLTWLTRMLDEMPAEMESSAWRISVLKAVAETGLADAGPLLSAALNDVNECVARCAARYLLLKRVPEWRDIAAAGIPRSPHLGVRKLAPTQGSRADSKAFQTDTHGFDRAWNAYQKQPPVVQHTTARSVATDPLLADQLRAKLQSGTPQDIAQGLKMLMPLPSLVPYRNQIIALCGHADPRISAMAVRLIGRLEDPKLKELLEAAAQHADARVRANAIESMEELHIADKSQQVITLLNSRHNRERANAIKAIGQFNFATARECLLRMLSDANPLHRMSALWVVDQLNLLEIMRHVTVTARRDPNLRVRKRAAEMVETLSGNLPSQV